MQKIIAMASAANLPVIPHVWGTNVGLAAALQLFAALPHFPERRFPAEPLFEYDRSPHPFRGRGDTASSSPCGTATWRSLIGRASGSRWIWRVSASFACRTRGTIHTQEETP